MRDYRVSLRSRGNGGELFVGQFGRAQHDPSRNAIELNKGDCGGQLIVRREQDGPIPKIPYAVEKSCAIHQV
jgi:hypothetical protein